MIKKLTVAAAAFLAAASVAGVAMSAQSTTTLNVRGGPSTSYGVVDVLFAGENVDVEECRTNGWCRISHSGPDGWVSSRYLTDTDSGDRRRPPVIDEDPEVNFSVNAPGFSFSIGNGDPRWRPGPGRPGPRDARVCFYEDWNFRGASFCLREGEQDRRLRSFNDRISSIRVIGNARARVCEDWNFNGRCTVIGNDNRRLTGRNNDIISSIRVN